MRAGWGICHLLTLLILPVLLLSGIVCILRLNIPYVRDFCFILDVTQNGDIDLHLFDFSLLVIELFHLSPLLDYSIFQLFITTAPVISTHGAFRWLGTVSHSTKFLLLKLLS